MSNNNNNNNNNNNKRSHQIEQFRWEVASAKSQADLTLEIDDFLKQESERTLPTLSSYYSTEDDSSTTRSGDFSAGSFTRRSAISQSCSARNSSRNSSSSARSSSLASSSSRRSITANPPLEIVFERNPTVDDNHPESQITKAKDNSIALFELCRVGDWFSVRAWLDAHSDDSLHAAIVAQHLSTRMTAFHMLLCAAASPPLYIVYRFATLAPEALRMVDTAGRLPLHHAIISSGAGAANSRVVDVLIKAYPEAAMVQDKTGLLPLLDRQSKSVVVKSEAWFENCT